jgi:hypothetical protein
MPCVNPGVRRPFVDLGEEGLEDVVALGVVVGAVLPGTPDDVEPGAGEDACD